jgi:predicted GH43/DUF377 family glycosyl hydrolase
MLRRAEAFLAALGEYPAGRYQGRGVVIAGGGDRFFASLYVSVRALRHVGCRLPVQVWYLGRHDEMPAARQALLAPWDVECIDADRVRRRHPARRLDGWELKVFAILHSPFKEVLFLDADCYPCRNPEFLFERDDYRTCGAIFWPDLAPSDPRLAWAAFGVADPRRPGSVESGQLVLHKRPSWQALNLTWFYNDHSDYYYRYCYGDKHTFEVAWARCGLPFVMWQPRSRWVDVAYLHDGPDQQPLFVHRCADKFRLASHTFTTPQRAVRQTYNPDLPLERECWGWRAELAQTLGAGRSRASRSLVPEQVVRVRLPGHYNCSIREHEGVLLLASRRDCGGPRVYLSELGADYQPRWTRPLVIEHPRAAGGVEDPRLFHFRGRLHCAFTGVEHDGSFLRTHQMLCRLDDDLRVEEVWLPGYEGRTLSEKNWQFFEHEGDLCCVYTVRPHVVLRHHGHCAEVAARTAAEFPQQDGHLRGGAPPVRHGDDYYHFFHSVQTVGGQFEYTAGLYTFAARPPFEVRRVVPDPVLYPDEADRPAGFDKSVVFPCGALWRDGRWVISYGYHDRECRIAVLDAGGLEQRLRAV